MDILLISETHLTPAVNDAAVRISGYALLRSDGGNTSKHGVCAYISEKLCFENIAVQVPNVILFYISALDIHVCTVYRPPSNSSDQDSLLISFLLDHLISFLLS